jgi:hypothetical protein
MASPTLMTRSRITMVLLAVPLTLAVSSAQPARAFAGDTLQIGIGAPSPEQGIPFAIEFSGTAEPVNSEGRGPSLAAVIRPAGGVGCQGSFANDHSAAGGVSSEIYGERYPYEPTQGPGSYKQVATYNSPSPGTYLVCAWLETSEHGGATLAGPVSATFTAGGPHVYELAVSLPEPALPGIAFQISYTTHTDQKLTMSSAIRPSGGLPCAATQGLDSQQNQSETALLFGPYSSSGESVFGGPVTTTATTTEPAGPYLVCTWIEGPSSDEIDATNATNIFVGTPPTPPQHPHGEHPASPLLSLRSVRVSTRHASIVNGKGVAALNGHLHITVTCGRSSVHSDARIVRGRFQLRLATPRRCHRGGRARVTVTWPGSRAFLAQSVSDVVRVVR